MSLTHFNAISLSHSLTPQSKKQIYIFELLAKICMLVGTSGGQLLALVAYSSRDLHNTRLSHALDFRLTPEGTLLLSRCSTGISC